MQVNLPFFPKAQYGSGSSIALPKRGFEARVEFVCQVRVEGIGGIVGQLQGRKGVNSSRVGAYGERFKGRLTYPFVQSPLWVQVLRSSYLRGFESRLELNGKFELKEGERYQRLTSWEV